MKKQKKQMLILLLLLVLLGAGFLGIRQYNKTQSGKPAKDDDTVTVAQINEDEILKFSYDYQEENYSFEKEDGVWYLENDHNVSLRQSGVNTMLMGFTPLKAEQVIENVTDMSQYGLEQPACTITLETAEETYIFQVGDNNAMSGIYYLKKPEENTVYLVDEAAINRFHKTPEDLKEAEESTESASEEAESSEEKAENAETVAESAENSTAETTEAE